MPSDAARTRTITSVVILAATVVTLGILACGGAIGWFVYSMSTMSADMDPEVERLFAAIDNNRAGQYFREHTTPELRKFSPEADFVRFTELVKKRLGRLQSKTVRSFNRRTFNATSNADMVYDAQFERGKAELILSWQRVGTGPWRLQTFRVNSMALIESPTRECQKCHAKIVEDARFCPQCGEAIEPAAKPDDAEASNEASESTDGAAATPTEPETDSEAATTTP